MAVKEYTKQYVRTLPAIYEKRALFLRTFGGRLQVKDGVKESDTFMEFKVSDTSDVVIQEYNTGENVAFGTGTGNSNRFGPRREIKSTTRSVNYKEPLAIHEGIDNFTVNDIPEQVVAERLALHAEAWTEHLNEVLAELLSTSASETLTGDVVKVFNDARATFLNNKVKKSLARVAYVTADVYNYLVDNNLTTSGKKSSANIDTGEIEKFKGFILEEIPDEYFQTGENIIFAVDNIGIVGVGVQIARAFDSEDFAGVALQGAAKYADYMPEENVKGILKANATVAEEVPAG